MNTYPIHPGDRLQTALSAVLESSLLSLDAFLGFTIHNEREYDEVQKPFLGIHVTESQQIHPRSPAWRMQVTVVMVEDREDANQQIAGDTRPRHELRAENVSARLFGVWEGSDIGAAITAESNGVGVIRAYNFLSGAGNGMTEDDVVTEYGMTIIATATEQ